MTEPDRRTRLLEAAADLVSVDGLGAVTHRSVEKATGLPHGSVTYYFSSRDGLISALVEWLCDQSEAQARAITALFDAQMQQGTGPDISVIAGALTLWCDQNAALHVARMELELQGARDPSHAARMTQAAELFWGICADVAAALGSSEPARDGRVMAAIIDGVLFDRLTHPGQPPEIAEAAVGWMLESVSRAGTGSPQS